MYDKKFVTFRFPNDARRPEWVAFVVDRGLAVNLSSALCSRHFVPGVDYAEGNARRRRLVSTAVPSLVSVLPFISKPTLQCNVTLYLLLYIT